MKKLKGKFVEIDESLVAKVKYNVGKGLGIEQIWMFGMVEREKKGKCYIVIVPDRKTSTLLAIINDVVEEQTTIVHDSWSSYNRITDLNKSYRTQRVNHKYNFVDPETGAHTNKIEGLWCQFKKKFKEMNGCSRVYLQSYLHEFMWRQWNEVDRIEAYEEILKEIGQLYCADEKEPLHFEAPEEEHEISFTELKHDEKDGTWSEDDLEDDLDLEEHPEDCNCGEESDEESDEKSDEESDEKSDEESDEKSDEESDEKSDEESDEKSDKKLLKKVEKILNVLSKNERCFEIKDLN